MLRVLFTCCLLLLSCTAAARVAGPLEVERPKATRDLASIRSSGELRVLVNQSRNSSGRSKARALASNTSACGPLSSTSTATRAMVARSS